MNEVLKGFEVSTRVSRICTEKFPTNEDAADHLAFAVNSEFYSIWCKVYDENEKLYGQAAAFERAKEARSEAFYKWVESGVVA